MAPPRRNTGLIVAIVIAVVLIAICIGAAIAVAQSQGLGQNSMGPGGLGAVGPPAVVS
jgi:hypothetical protein